MTTKQYKRDAFEADAFEAIHDSASALLKAGAIDKAAMREFDQSCLGNPQGTHVLLDGCPVALLLRLGGKCITSS